MKKLILILVFVFAMGSFTNVNASTHEIKSNIESVTSEVPDCYDFATAMEWMFGGGYETFSEWYETCINQYE